MGKEQIYRRLDNDTFCEGSGCGPTLKTEDPFVRQHILDALLELVQIFRIDGFRFDLGALHDVEFILPEGKWNTLVDGQRILVDKDGLKDIPLAHGIYMFSEHRFSSVPTASFTLMYR